MTRRSDRPEPGLTHDLLGLDTRRSSVENLEDIVRRIEVFEDIVANGGAFAPAAAVGCLRNAKQFARLAIRVLRGDQGDDDGTVLAMRAVDHAWRAQVEIGIPQAVRVRSRIENRRRALDRHAGKKAILAEAWEHFKKAKYPSLAEGARACANHYKGPNAPTCRGFLDYFREQAKVEGITFKPGRKKVAKRSLKRAA